MEIWNKNKIQNKSIVDTNLQISNCCNFLSFQPILMIFFSINQNNFSLSSFVVFGVFPGSRQNPLISLHSILRGFGDPGIGIVIDSAEDPGTEDLTPGRLLKDVIVSLIVYSPP